MKKYIKPEITIVEMDMDTHLMQGSFQEKDSYTLDTEITNELDRSKRRTYNVWGYDEEED
jgi:hypothetical protein